MNLIEQIGGYAQAKALRALPAATYDCGIKFNREELELSMLEYRRQHNIFEEGDWVVIPSRGNGIFQVSRLLCRSDVQEMIHATDAEIKAGRRL